MDIKIYRGDSLTITETISGLTSLDGFTAKMYIATRGGTVIDTITGSISDLVVTYSLLNEVTKAYTAGRYKFETKLYNASDEVYTPHKGQFVIEGVINSDPS